MRQLDGDLASGAQVGGAIDRGHAAAGDEVLDAVVVELIARTQWSHRALVRAGTGFLLYFLRIPPPSRPVTMTDRELYVCTPWSRLSAGHDGFRAGVSFLLPKTFPLETVPGRLEGRSTHRPMHLVNHT